MKPPRSISSLVVVVATAATLVAGCGGGDDSNGSANANSGGSSTGGASPKPASASSSAVRISDFKFVPATLTVKQGASVKVSNDDSTAHTATSNDGHSFDTGDINPGSSKTISAKPGSYAYHCSIHPFMHGKLIVK